MNVDELERAPKAVQYILVALIGVSAFCIGYFGVGLFTGHAWPLW